jgi:hypothetical protein
VRVVKRKSFTSLSRLAGAIRYFFSLWKASAPSLLSTVRFHRIPVAIMHPLRGAVKPLLRVKYDFKRRPTLGDHFVAFIDIAADTYRRDELPTLDGRKRHGAPTPDFYLLGYI